MLHSAFDNICIVKYIYIVNAGEGRFTSHAVVLKLMIMIKHMKMTQIPYLDIWSMLLSGQVPHRINSSQLFWNELFQKKTVEVKGGRG